MATRFFFPEATPADVTPALSAWTVTTGFVRRKMVVTKGPSAITVGATVTLSGTAGHTGLNRQYVSDPMAAGVVFGTSTGRTGQLMTREYATADNVDRVASTLKVVSEDGATLRATLLGLATTWGSTLEFINNVTHRNHTWQTGVSNLSYTTVLGDRLVLEIGFSNSTSGSSPQASAKWGENATDLPVNNTQTTDGAGWFELSTNITFVTPTPPPLFLWGGLPGHRRTILRRF